MYNNEFRTVANFRNSDLMDDDFDLGFIHEATDDDYKNSTVLSTEPTDKGEKKTRKQRSDAGVPKNNQSLPTSYRDEYAETDALLRMSISQIDTFTANIEADLSSVRSNKSLTKKYDYISTLVGTEASLIGNKISAIREMNNAIKNSNDMEFKRIKDLKIGSEAIDDNKILSDIYDRMLRDQGQFAPPQQVSSGIYMPTAVGNPAGLNNSSDIGYQEYMQNLSPEQNLMLLEGDPNIEEVVCYNQDTGAAFFDIINTVTGESIPNVPKKDPMFMEHTVLDLTDRIATNAKLGESYKIYLIGSSVVNNSILSQY